MSRCSRCDWQHDPDDETRPREQLAGHATDAGHPLCIVCHGSLTRDERQTCERCITSSRETLAGILLLWQELPRHLGHVRGASYDSDRPSAADGRPLPGGDVLVLAGPGSAGTASRRLTPGEVRDGLDGREHGWDNRPTDGVSVQQLLASWVQDWKEIRGEL